MITSTLPEKVKIAIGAGQSVIVSSGPFTVHNLKELAKILGPDQTLTIRSAQHITEDKINEIAKSALPGKIIFDFTIS